MVNVNLQREVIQYVGDWWTIEIVIKSRQDWISSRREDSLEEERRGEKEGNEGKGVNMERIVLGKGGGGLDIGNDPIVLYRHAICQFVFTHTGPRFRHRHRLTQFRAVIVS